MPDPSKMLFGQHQRHCCLISIIGFKLKLAQNATSNDVLSLQDPDFDIAQAVPASSASTAPQRAHTSRDVPKESTDASAASPPEHQSTPAAASPPPTPTPSASRKVERTYSYGSVARHSSTLTCKSKLAYPDNNSKMLERNWSCALQADPKHKLTCWIVICRRGRGRRQAQSATSLCCTCCSCCWGWALCSPCSGSSARAPGRPFWQCQPSATSTRYGRRPPRLIESRKALGRNQTMPWLRSLQTSSVYRLCQTPRPYAALANITRKL